MEFKANGVIRNTASSQEIFCLPSQASIQGMLSLHTNALVFRFRS